MLSGKNFKMTSITTMDWNGFSHPFQTLWNLWTCLSPSQTILSLKLTSTRNHWTSTCISSSSAHPPGMIAGLVFGMILGLWLWKLWSRVSDIKRRIKIFYRCLIRRGYSKDTLIPLFTKATKNAHQHLRRTPQQLCAIQDKKIDSRIPPHLLPPPIPLQWTQLQNHSKFKRYDGSRSFHPQGSAI